jgi:protein translocase SecG subunit
MTSLASLAPYIVSVLPYIQIALSIILVGVILLQETGSGVGGVLGGGDGGGLYHTRRGFEKFLFITTIVIAVLFSLSALLAILVK